MTTETPRVSDEELRGAMVPRVDSARRSRQWAVIEAELTPRRTGIKVWGGLASAAAVVGCAWFFGFETGSSVEASSSFSDRMDGDEPSEKVDDSMRRLTDGSIVSLGAQSTFQVLESTNDVERLALSGSASFQVSKAPGRDFFVEAGPVTVRVIGTMFEVNESSRAVTVRVQEGLVEVLYAGESKSLGAGQKWEVVFTDVNEPARAEKGTPTSAPVVVSAADALFKRATTARANGNSNDAAQLFSEFARRHPDDARAKMAAFEAARVQQDVLEDPRAALDELGRTGNQTKDPWNEYALARKVQALDSTDQRAECKEVQREYLLRYPDGANKGSVETACRSAP